MLLVQEENSFITFHFIFIHIIYKTKLWMDGRTDMDEKGLLRYPKNGETMIKT